MLCWAVSVWTSCRDSDTTLLGSWYASESFWTGAANIFPGDLAQGVRSTGSFLLAGVDTLEADANLIGGAVLVVPAAEGADTVAADLGAGALLAGDAGDHAHAVAALLAHQAVILTTTGVPTLSTLAGGATDTVTVSPATLAVSYAGSGIQRTRDKPLKTLTLSLAIIDGALGVGSA